MCNTSANEHGCVTLVSQPPVSRLCTAVDFEEVYCCIKYEKSNLRSRHAWNLAARTSEGQGCTISSSSHSPGVRYPASSTVFSHVKYRRHGTTPPPHRSSPSPRDIASFGRSDDLNLGEVFQTMSKKEHTRVWSWVLKAVAPIVDEGRFLAQQQEEEEEEDEVCSTCLPSRPTYLPYSMGWYCCMFPPSQTLTFACRIAYARHQDVRNRVTQSISRACL